jgi:suppressor of ftsI
VAELTRRQLLAGTAVGSAVVALGAAATTALARCSRHTNPAAEGEWIELETAVKETTLDGHRVRLRAYNGQIPGPVIETRPGNTLRIRLKNSLPPYDSSAWTGDHNVPHGFDATNLHVHGLDVVPHIFEPVGTSDPLAPQIVVPPGHTKEYVFELPDDHPPGFCFYHPHKHGSTTVQVATGLAGPIVVRGDIDEVPEIKAAREVFLAVQDIGLFPGEDDPNVATTSRPKPQNSPRCKTLPTTGTSVRAVTDAPTSLSTARLDKRTWSTVNGQWIFRLAT